MRGTIVAVDPTENELLVRTDTGAGRALDAAYVAQHLEHAYALTAHTMQGGTVESAGVVGHPDDFTRNWSYTALSRARDATEIFLIDTPTEHQPDRAEIAPDHPKELVDERTPLERLAAAMRQRDDEDLALDRIRTDSIASAAPGDATLPPARANADAAAAPLSRSVDELRTELAELREHIASQPDAPAGRSAGPRATHGPKHNASPTRRARESPNSSGDPAPVCVAARAINRRWPSNASASAPQSANERHSWSANESSPAASPTAGLSKPSAQPGASALQQSRRSSPYSVSTERRPPPNPLRRPT